MTADIVQELGIVVTVKKVTGICTILGYGIMSTPGMVIDEKVAGYGGVPSKQQFIQITQQASAA
ncbi:MAG: thioredoxin family protein [Chloroflexi bacterium]|nr:MAG: thioredoxin family protein [Chloroflexota bacterium]